MTGLRRIDRQCLSIGDLRDLRCRGKDPGGALFHQQRDELALWRAVEMTEGGVDGAPHIGGVDTGELSNQPTLHVVDLLALTPDIHAGKYYALTFQTTEFGDRVASCA